MDQWLALKKKFPASKGGVRRNQMKCTLELQPSGLSDVYTVEIRYSLERSPKVFVRDPELETRESKRPPHTYKNGSLCLYLPSKREWGRHMYLSDTILPWTSEWLLHYEIWLGTGEWCGGGIHPGGDIKPDLKPKGKAPRRPDERCYRQPKP